VADGVRHRAHLVAEDPLELLARAGQLLVEPRRRQRLQHQVIARVRLHVHARRLERAHLAPAHQQLVGEAAIEVAVPLHVAGARQLVEKTRQVEIVEVLHQAQHRAQRLRAARPDELHLQERRVAHLEPLLLRRLEQVRRAIPPEDAPLLEEAGGDEEDRLDAVPLQDRQRDVVVVAIAVVEGDRHRARRQPLAGGEAHDLVDAEHAAVARDQRHLPLEVVRRRVHHALVERVRPRRAHAVVGEHGEPRRRGARAQAEQQLRRPGLVQQLQ
jgi:hypothetical protein